MNIFNNIFLNSFVLSIVLFFTFGFSDNLLLFLYLSIATLGVYKLFFVFRFGIAYPKAIAALALFVIALGIDSLIQYYLSQTFKYMSIVDLITLATLEVLVLDFYLLSLFLFFNIPTIHKLSFKVVNKTF